MLQVKKLAAVALLVLASGQARAGLPGLISAGAGVLGWWRRKRKVEAVT